MTSNLLDIGKVAAKLGLTENDLERYGNNMAKVSLDVLNRVKDRPRGKLILVTAMNPTKEGEGKTTTTIGLGQALNIMGRKVAIAIREPSLGPCFGIKGGATGGGKSTVEPSDRINLIFTGDFPAVSAAHNLLSAMINNHIYHGNKMRIDPRKVTFPRTIDMNDRSLRDIIVGSGGSESGILMKDKFVITPASEIMAILGLSSSYSDLKQRLSRILVGYSFDGKPVYAGDIKAHGAMAALLRDALKPNLVQTAEGVPAFVHIGPFGNIAHGTSSIIADRMALGLTDYLVTEAGFGSELGGEKFLDMVSRIGNLPVDAVVLVATIRSIKLNAGVSNSRKEDVAAVEAGVQNVLKHVEILRNFGIDPVVAINRFPTDTDKEIAKLEEILKKSNVVWALSEVFAKGGQGGLDMAGKVMEKLSRPVGEIKRTYGESDPVRDKIIAIAKNVYGASDVIFEKKAETDLKNIEKIGMGQAYVCMAKNQYSLTDDPNVLGWPKNFKIHVKAVSVSSGAGFVVPMLGDIMTMPGLPTEPAANNVDLTEDGTITGLF
ncbi:MAG: formate--tetrahydrofolate ligase [Candidatus Thermoplasmatota archaeon]|jgi:formate--tetrahydrofolate ligase|nr:formate--tetrahydrofolate ligase [Candidatus Thermoplasmatota archaeon]